MSASSFAADRTILILGDSLSAGYGMDIEKGWVSLLEERLAAQGYRYRILNASISGDTSRGARARLDALLENTAPEVAVVELGGNDGLRGISLEELEDNLDAIVRSLKSAGSRVLLIPMRLPPNYGPAYTGRFEKIYRDVAGKEDVQLGTFLLDGVVLKEGMMQEDGLHAGPAAQPVILENIWRDLEPLLRRPNQSSTATQRPKLHS